MFLTKRHMKLLVHYLTDFLKTRSRYGAVTIDASFRKNVDKKDQKVIQDFMKWKVLVPRDPTREIEPKELAIQIALGSITRFVLDLNPNFKEIIDDKAKRAIIETYLEIEEFLKTKKSKASK